LSKRGIKDLDTMSSYISLKQINPDLILSSLALRAQLTADKIAQKVGYKGQIHYMNELYMVRPDKLINILSLQDNQYNNIFLVGHNPELTELANSLIEERLSKLPTLGIIGITLDIDSWSEIRDTTGKIEIFTYPKQFRYYMPREIQKAIKEDNL